MSAPNTQTNTIPMDVEAAAELVVTGKALPV